MFNIFKFLRKTQFLVLFLILEMIFLKFFFHYKEYQDAIFIERVMSITGKMNAYFSSWSDYFSLEDVNKKLVQENVLLRNQLQNTYNQIPSTQQIQIDTTIETNNRNIVKQYQLLEAKVTYNTTAYRNNFFQIQRGALQGIKKNMGVMSAQGIAGIVVNTSDNFSNVLSILNMTTKVSAKLKNSDAIAYFQWDGKTEEEGVVENYPLNTKVNIGDTLVTSMYSEKFIPHTIIGTVKSFSIKPNKNNYTLKIQLSVKFYELNHVYVIHNKFQDEVLTLQTTYLHHFNEK